jgi:CCR4-NOT complex subunit CAF16
LKRAEELPDLAAGRLHAFVGALLRAERDALRAARAAAGVPEKELTYDPAREGVVGAFSYVFNNGWVPGTLTTSLANSSNAVMRM